MAVAENLQFRDDGVTLYYQAPASQNSYDVPADYHSEVLEVRRTLWVESDHMGAPGANDGPFGGDPELDDDDHFDLEFTPSDPTINTLSALLAPAYVRVLALPAQYDTRNVTDFKHYQYSVNGESDVVDAESSRYFWHVHMLGAYEWSMALDNDPDDQSWLAGWSEASDEGTNYIFEETARDLWAEPQFQNMVSYAVGLDRLSAHEALHRFFGWHMTIPGTNPPQLDADHYSNHGIMDRDTLFTADTVQLTDEQIRVVQAKDFPR